MEVPRRLLSVRWGHPGHSQERGAGGNRHTNRFTSSHLNLFSPFLPPPSTPHPHYKHIIVITWLDMLLHGCKLFEKISFRENLWRFETYDTLMIKLQSNQLRPIHTESDLTPWQDHNQWISCLCSPMIIGIWALFILGGAWGYARNFLCFYWSNGVGVHEILQVNTQKKRGKKRGGGLAWILPKFCPNFLIGILKIYIYIFYFIFIYWFIIIIIIIIIFFFFFWGGGTVFPYPPPPLPFPPHVDSL